MTTILLFSVVDVDGKDIVCREAEGDEAHQYFERAMEDIARLKPEVVIVDEWREEDEVWGHCYCC